MSNQSLFPGPNQRKQHYGDANLFHSTTDTTQEANEENKDHKQGNFNPVRKSFEEKKATANDTTENANKEKNDHKQGKPDFLKNLSKEHRDTSSNDTSEDAYKKSTDHKQKKHDHWKNLLEEFRETASQTSRDDNKRKQNDTYMPDDLNSHISKDDTGVRFGKNSSNSDITTKLTIEQKRRAYDDIRMFIENEKLNQLNRKLANDRLRDKGIDPKEFRDTGKKLHDLLQADLDGKMISTTDFEIAYKKFNRMVQKLGDTDKKIARNYF